MVHFKSCVNSIASIPVRRPKRQDVPESPRLIHCPRIRRPLQPLRAAGAPNREALRNPVGPVRAEQRRRRRAVGHRVILARGPGPRAEIAVQPGIRPLQPLRRERQCGLRRTDCAPALRKYGPTKGPFQARRGRNVQTAQPRTETAAHCGAAARRPSGMPGRSDRPGIPDQNRRALRVTPTYRSASRGMCRRWPADVFRRT